MKTACKIKVLLLSMIMLTVVAHATSAYCETNSELYLRASDDTPVIGRTFSVDVCVKDSIAVYGAEFIVQYDPSVLTVVDALPEKEGIQIAPGDFFDLERLHFPLQNHVDAKNGKIYYAVSMLNPSPEASGEGTLGTIRFRASGEGQTRLRFANGKMGTRGGVSISPTTAECASLEVVSEKPFYVKIGGYAVVFVAAASLFAVLGLAMRRKKSAVA